MCYVKSPTKLIRYCTATCLCSMNITYVHMCVHVRTHPSLTHTAGDKKVQNVYMQDVWTTEVSNNCGCIVVHILQDTYIHTVYALTFVGLKFH